MYYIVDIIILLLIALGAIVGFKEGAVKRLTTFIGTLVIAIIAFKFKNNLSVLMYENLPFFRFGGIIKGVEVLNILLYEILAFLIIFLALTLLLRILIVVSGLVEKILKMTIFLSIPSKILGIFIGAFEWYIYIFLILVVVSIPMFGLKPYIEDSKIATFMLDNTPILTPLAKSTTDTYTDVYKIIKNSKNENPEELNDQIVKILLDNEVVTTDSINILIDRGKIHLTTEFTNKLQNSQNNTNY